MDAELRQEVAVWLSNLGAIEPARRLIACGEGGRGWVGHCPNGHEVYHHFCCEQRICPSCAARRSRSLANKLSPAVYDVVRSSPGEYGLKHLVLGTTINVCDYLKIVNSKKLDAALLKSLAYKVKLWRGFAADLLRDYSKNGDVLGFAIGAEFGMKAGTLHFHVLMLSKYIDHKIISRDWEQKNLGMGSYVWIRAVDRDEHSIAQEVGYVTKYVTKPLVNVRRDGDVITPNVERLTAFYDEHGTAAVLAAVSYLFIGVRRFQTYGCFFNMEFEPEAASVCPECGGELIWASELDRLQGWGSDFLKTLATNKLNGDGGILYQLALF